MPTWGEINNEIIKLLKSNQNAFDIVRKKYVKELFDNTKRNTIIYATKWTPGEIQANLVSIVDEDIQAFMEAINGLKGDELDLILHTPGGSGEATEAIVSYLRKKFNYIRIIVPQAAMSAGTMLCCAADEIVMGKHSFLGPTDPQVILQTPVGVQAIAAHAIIEQFQRAQTEISNNPKLLNSWLPMLSQFGPALLVQCQNQITFSKKLVEDWLQKYMFKNEGDAKEKATNISDYLSTHSNFKTHSKHLNIDDIEKIGIKVKSLEADQVFQERVLSAFHATTLTFNAGAIKIICNQNGNTFVKNIQQIQIKQQPAK